MRYILIFAPVMAFICGCQVSPSSQLPDVEPSLEDVGASISVWAPERRSQSSEVFQVILSDLIENNVAYTGMDIVTTGYFLVPDEFANPSDRRFYVCASREAWKNRSVFSEGILVFTGAVEEPWDELLSMDGRLVVVEGRFSGGTGVRPATGEDLQWAINTAHPLGTISASSICLGREGVAQ